MKELSVGTREFLRNFNKLIAKNMRIKITHRGRELGVFEPNSGLKDLNRRKKFTLDVLKKYVVPLKKAPKDLSENIDKVLYGDS